MKTTEGDPSGRAARGGDNGMATQEQFNQMLVEALQDESVRYYIREIAKEAMYDEKRAQERFERELIQVTRSGKMREILEEEGLVPKKTD
jgi:hypothetical protein